ncbi:GDP-mannose 4,6-dehydratase [Desulfobacterales bacterium HSG17]|nr:GDP-mannose 4,6-dehydratase [Desulfobacterales bacterium HSG17]
MGKKIIVLGSNSFSGSHFIDIALEQGFDVAGISRSKEAEQFFLPYKWHGKTEYENFRFFQYDLNHDLEKIMALVQDFKPEYIVNFAAQSMVGQSWERPEDWFKTNVVSTINFHDRLRTYSFIEKYVHISTPEVYGACEGLIKENTIYNPSTPYAVSRASADMSLMSFLKNYDFPVVFIRAANVYGPGQQLYRIIPRAILFFKTDRKLQLHGGGASIRSFIDIKDVVHGTIKAMRNGKPGEIFHFATSENNSIRSLVEKIADIMDIDFNEYVQIAEERPGKDAAYLLDSSKAKKELGWKDKLSLDDGIKQVVSWVEENLNELLKQPLDYIHKS